MEINSNILFNEIDTVCSWRSIDCVSVYLVLCELRVIDCARQRKKENLRSVNIWPAMNCVCVCRDSSKHIPNDIDYRGSGTNEKRKNGWSHLHITNIWLVPIASCMCGIAVCGAHSTPFPFSFSFSLSPECVYVRYVYHSGYSCAHIFLSKFNLMQTFPINKLNNLNKMLIVNCQLQLIRFRFVFLSFFRRSGTRIIYERSFLMNLKNSPLSRTPPSNVPSVLMRGGKNVPMSKLGNNTNGSPFSTYNKTNSPLSKSPPLRKSSDEQQFDMDL